MRNLLLYIVLFVHLFAACGSDDNASVAGANVTANNGTAQKTQIQWIDSSVNYGKINEGQKLAVSFRFKNSGNTPLIIESVKPTCGCTVADYPKEPIAPGAEAEITGEFDSNGREGLQRKHITVRTNTEPAETDVTFEVVVTGKSANQQQNTSF